MEDKDYLFIDRYLQGELNADEAAQFQTRIDNDPLFAAAFRERQVFDRYLRVQQRVPELKKNMEALNKQYFREASATETQEANVKPLWQKPSAWIAAVAAAVALLLVLWNPFRPAKSLYEQFAIHQQLVFAERGDGAQSREEAQVAFNRGEYKAAYPQLLRLEPDMPDNAQLQLAIGVAALETGRTVEARSRFQALADGNTALQPYGLWYLALTEVKRGSPKQAIPFLERLEQQSSPLKEKAQALRQQL